MVDVLQLIPEPEPERDEAIFDAWRKGQKTVQKLAREHGLPETQVKVILDRYLPSLTPQAQVRELQKLLFDLDELRAEFHDVAMTEHNADAANVAIRAGHEIAQLRQFVGATAYRDPVELARASDPRAGSSTEAWQRAIDHLCGAGTATSDNAEKIGELAKPDQDQQA
jgi:hypothetical protein